MQIQFHSMSSRTRVDASRASSDHPDSRSEGLHALRALLLEAIEHIGKSLKHPLQEADPILEVGERTLSMLPVAYEKLLDLSSDKMYAFRYDEVPLCWIRLYEEAQLYAVSDMRKTYGTLLCQPQSGLFESVQIKAADCCLTEIIRRLDMALIKTQGIERKLLIYDTLNVLNVFSVKIRQDSSSDYSDDDFLSFTQESADLAPEDKEAFFKGPKQRNRDLRPPQPPEEWINQYLMPQNMCQRFADAQDAQGRYPKVTRSAKRFADILDDAVSLHHFRMHRTADDQPVVIPGSVRGWPAIERWPDPMYWLRNTHGGRRLVPIEIGSMYTDTEWRQEIVDFRSFMDRYLLAPHKPSHRQDIRPTIGESTRSVGYLAQHEFFGQIPTFYGDIAVPGLCYVSPLQAKDAGITSTAGRGKLKRKRSFESDELHLGDTRASLSHETSTCRDPCVQAGLNREETSPDDGEDDEIKINIWLGPANTVSPAHTDPHNNILCQAMGRKYVRLFAPTEHDNMYPIVAPSTGIITQEPKPSEAHRGHEAASFHDKYQSKQYMLTNASTDAQYRATGVTNCKSEETMAQRGPTDSVDMSNTSRLDVGLDVDWRGEDASEAYERRQKRYKQLQDFPKSANASFQECILEPGDCLFIPRGWWHYVQSLDVSASVSFWWD